MLGYSSIVEVFMIFMKLNHCRFATVWLKVRFVGGFKYLGLMYYAEMCDNFKAYYSGELSSRDFVQKIQDGIRQRNAENYDLNQMKSTLLLCAICKDRYIIGHIGDGAILCFGKESYVISPPQKNEIGGTATYTVLDYNADEHFKFKRETLKILMVFAYK